MTMKVGGCGRSDRCVPRWLIRLFSSSVWLLAVLLPATARARGGGAGDGFEGLGPNRPGISAETPPAIPVEVYGARRVRLLELLDGRAAVLFSAPVRHRNGDVDYAYRQDSDFYYMTGLTAANAAVMITRRRGAPHTTLFVTPTSPMAERWTGKRIGIEEARSLPGVDEAFDLRELDARLSERLSDAERVCVGDGGERRSRDRVRDLLPAGAVLEDVHPLVAGMRLLKDGFEQRMIHHAARITASALREAMRLCRPGLAEYHLEALIEYLFLSQGAKASGFPCIVGSGPNSCVLHYQRNDRDMRSGDLVVLDVGAEYGLYSADITRTIPVSGRFSPEQAALYDLVLAANQAGIEAARSGAKVSAVGQACREVVERGLEEIGLDLAVGRAMIHGVTHWVGLDVHDAGPRGVKTLAPGMVLTVEPGMYIPEGTDVDERWWGIGIRIEDDVLVTRKGPEVLSDEVPKTRAAIEALMSGPSRFPDPRSG